MTVTRFARGSKRNRRGRREIRERFLSIDRPFYSPPPKLNDGGVREGTAIWIDLKNAQSDDAAGIRVNEGSARVENNSGHDTLSAYVVSSELYATSNPSRLDSRRHDFFECIPLDDRLPLSEDTVADALLEDEIFYRSDTSTPVLQDPNPLGEGNYLLEPLE
jgi:hypothetical protein